MAANNRGGVETFDTDSRQKDQIDSASPNISSNFIPNEGDPQQLIQGQPN